MQSEPEMVNPINLSYCHVECPYTEILDHKYWGCSSETSEYLVNIAIVKTCRVVLKWDHTIHINQKKETVDHAANYIWKCSMLNYVLTGMKNLISEIILWFLSAVPWIQWNVYHVSSSGVLHCYTLSNSKHVPCTNENASFQIYAYHCYCSSISSKMQYL